MLLNLRDLGEIRADEMREVKSIILMGIGHDLQETFIPGRKSGDQGFEVVSIQLSGLSEDELQVASRRAPTAGSGMGSFNEQSHHV